MSHLNQLRTFLETYRSGSISKAAARLGLTQPAASAHVQAIEATLGKQLFSRTARGVEPELAAHELARAIGSHLDAVEAGLGVLKARSTVIAGTISLAGPAEFVGYRVAPRLGGLVDLGLRIRLLTGNRERIYGWLEGGIADLAVTASRPTGRALGYQEIARERLLLVAAPTLARRLAAFPLSPASLAGAPLVAYDDELPLVREYFRTVFHADPEHQAAVVAPDLRLVSSLVEAGVGWSVLPDYICADGLRTGALISLQGPETSPTNPIHLAWVRSALRHPRVAYVRDRLLEEARAGAFA